MRGSRREKKNRRNKGSNRKKRSITEVERVKKRERKKTKKAYLRCLGTKYSPLCGITHTDVALAESGLQ